MADTAIAADLDETTNAQGKLTAEITFDAIILFEDLTYPAGLAFRHISDARCRRNASSLYDLLRTGQTNAVDVGEGIFNAFVAWQVHASNTCLTAPPFLTLPLLMLGIDADYTHDTLTLDDFAFFANLLYGCADFHDSTSIPLWNMELCFHRSSTKKQSNAQGI